MANQLNEYFDSLIAALNAIYAIKCEPAVDSVRDELVQEKRIAILCFLAGILKSTNVLQTILQESRLTFLEIKPAVENLLKII